MLVYLAPQQPGPRALTPEQACRAGAVNDGAGPAGPDRLGVRRPGAERAGAARNEVQRIDGDLALVRGRPRSRTGRIEAPIGRDRNDPLRRSLDTDTPRDAVTHFELEELLPEHALLRVRLETGRTHQIRVHLAAIDLPISGDPVYGVKGDLGLERQFLHAARLAFVHPITGEPIEVDSALPPDLAKAVERASSS